MCLTCGCNVHSHDHDHGHSRHHHTHDAPIGAVHYHGTDQARAIKVEEDILAANNRYAEANRALFVKHKILALNLMSSPGSGKTTLLARTLAERRFPAAVIEGNYQDYEADRHRRLGTDADQPHRIRYKPLVR